MMAKSKNMNGSESKDHVRVIDMKSAAWKKFIHGCIANVERELRPSAPAKSKTALKEFRARVSRDHVRRRRKRFENDLDKLIETDPVLRAAMNRYTIRVLRETTKKLKAATKDLRGFTKVLKAKKLAKDRAVS